MTQEEQDKTIQFLLEHQATFAAQMQKINETLDRHSEAIVGLTGIVGRLANLAEEHEKRLAGLEERQGGTQERLTALEVKFATMVERMDAFIVVVEKYIAGNGRKRQGRKR